MKIINLSLDSKILDANSEVAQRALAYADLVDKYTVVVPGANQEIKLSDKFNIIAQQGSHKFFTLFKIYQYLKKLLAKEKYDLITVQDVYYLAWVAKLIAKKFNLKLEIQIHGLEKFTGLRKKIAQAVIPSADQIRVVSQRLQNKIKQEFKISEIKIKVVPVFINIGRVTNSPIKINLKEKYPNDFIFLTVGRLVRVKNISLQLKALAKLDQSLKVKLIIIGSGPEEKSLKNLIQDLNLTDKVEFVNWTDDLTSYYQTADCLLLTSNSEGYGLVVGEAVLADLPVIMTDVGCAGELVQNNVNGLIVAINNLEQLFQAMETILKDSVLREKFKHNNQAIKSKIPRKQDLIQQIVNNWYEIINTHSESR